MLRILNVIPYAYLPPRSGGAFCVYYQHKYMCRYAKLFVAGSKQNAHQSEFEQLPVFSNSILRYANPVLFFTLRNLIRKHKLEVIQADHHYLAWLLVPLSRWMKIALIIRSHNIEFQRFKTLGKWWWPIMRQYELWAYRNCAQVWFITEEDKQVVQQQLPKATTRWELFRYGTELTQPPTDRAACKQNVKEKHSIPAEHRILLFNGSLSYEPNRKGLDVLLHQINPMLAEAGIPYTLIICGNQLPAAYNNLEAYKNQHILYAGFVDDIGIYFKAADIFLNPIVSGGGVKTKLVDAIAYNTFAVSTENGAIGLEPHCTGSQLVRVADNEWLLFTEKVLSAMKNVPQLDTPSAFYSTYSWNENARSRIEQINLK